MTTPLHTSPPDFGIAAGHTVRLIGATPRLEAALAPLTKKATVTPLASEPADVGIILVTDEADLRERLFTELDGLLGARHVWILTDSDSGPSAVTIAGEADHIGWHAAPGEAFAERWIAVALSKA